MARAVRWQGTFVSLSGISCTVKIYAEGWTGDITTLTMAEDPFVYEEDDSDNLLDVIRVKTGYIRVVEESYGALSAIFPQTNTERYVTVHYGSSLAFMGFIQAQSFDQEYAPAPRVLSLPVTSPLGIAGGLKMPTPSSPSYRTLAAALKDAVDTLNAGIVNLTFPDYMIDSNRVLAMQINTLSYCPYNDDYNIYVGSIQTLYSPQTVLEFLEALCNCFGMMVHDVGTEIVFTRYDYNGNYNQYVVNTMGSSSPSYRAITSGSTVLSITGTPKSDNSKETTIMPVSKVEINYEDEVDPTYEVPYNRCKAHTYDDNWVLLTPSTDEITSSYMDTSSMPTTTSNNVAVCATNGAEAENGFTEMIMFSRVTEASELFAWKLHNLPKYANLGCKLSFKLKAVEWHEVDGKYYYNTTDAKAKSMGVRIKNGGLYFQSNGTWAAAPDVIYRNTGGTEGNNATWELTLWRSMYSITSPLEITFFYGDNDEQGGLYAIEDIKIEPIKKGIASYVSNDMSDRVELTSGNGSKDEAPISQTINVKRKSEDALVNASGGFYSMVACRYTYMFVTQYRIDYDTYVYPSAMYYLGKVSLGTNSNYKRIIGFKFDLWNDVVTVMAQGSSTL